MADALRSMIRSGCGPMAGACAVVVALMTTAAPAFAQGAAESVERFSLDSVIGVDSFGGENVSSRPQIVIDVSAAVRIGDNWQLYVRPWFRLPRPASGSATTPPWDTEIYQAGVRYERPGPIAVPDSTAATSSRRSVWGCSTRGRISMRIFCLTSATWCRCRRFPPAAPRVLAVSNAYPLGAQLTISTSHWDARAAVVNSAPTRPYILGATTNPRQTPVVVAGGGITPFTGLRLGASFAHGDYATAEEVCRFPMAERGP